MNRSTAAVRLLAGDKEPVRFKTTGNHTLSGLAAVNTDGVTPVAGDRALVSSQTDATANGIYTASEGVWRRAPDSGSSRVLIAGMKVHVQEGSIHAGAVWSLQTDRPNVGDDDIEFALFIDTKSTEQMFSKLADVVVAAIPQLVTTVRTLGRNAPGDHGHASYSEIDLEDYTGASWQVLTANNRAFSLVNSGAGVTPEVFGARDGEDCTVALMAMSSWLNLVGAGLGGAVVNCKPGANYKAWSAGTTPAMLIFLINAKGITFNCNGARITTDNLFAPNGSPYVFYIQGCSQLTFNDPSFEQTGHTALDYTKGATFFNVGSGGSSNIRINNLKQKGGIGGLIVSTANYTGPTTHGITLLNADFDTVFYPMNFQYSGDDFFARGVNCVNAGRAYFVYGVYNHDVQLTASGGSNHDIINLAQYAQPAAPPERNTLSNITVHFRDMGRVTTSPALVSINLLQSVAPMTVTGAANNGSGKVRLTVNSTASAATGQTWNFASIGGTVEANGTNLVTVVDATHLDLLAVPFVNAYTTGGYGRVPAGMKNIKIILDVNDTTGNGQPCAVVTRKYTHAGLPDIDINGYVLDNIDISGTLKNYNLGGRVIDLFTNNPSPGSLGYWFGETIRNIRIHDLTISGASGSVYVDAVALASLQLENIVSASAITWFLTNAGSNTRITNVSATGITDRVSAAVLAADPAQMVTGIGADGSLLRRPFGFATGAGGTGTQLTDKSTGVTLHKASGRITTHGASLAANTGVVFTLTNATIAATDNVAVNLVSGHATPGTYHVQAEAAAAGSVKILIRNLTGGALAETLLLQFSVVKGAIT